VSDILVYRDDTRTVKLANIFSLCWSICI